MGLVAIEDTGNAIRWTANGRDVHSARSLAVLVNKMAEPSAFICEPGFFYGLRDVRRELEAWLAEHGHTLVPVPHKVQDVLARAAGTEVPGPGVASLHALASAGARSLNRTATETSNFWDVRDAVAVAVAVDLFGGSPPSSMVQSIRSALELDEAAASVLRHGDDFRHDVLYAALRAASVSPNRNTFERLLGLSGEAHGPLARVIRRWYEERNTTGTFERESVLKWSDYRRALRRVFHLANQMSNLEVVAPDAR